RPRSEISSDHRYSDPERVCLSCSSCAITRPNHSMKPTAPFGTKSKMIVMTPAVAYLFIRHSHLRSGWQRDRDARAQARVRSVVGLGNFTDYSTPFAVQVCSLQALRSAFAGPQ